MPLSVTEAVLIKGMETEASCNDRDDSCIHPDSSSSQISYRVHLDNGTNAIVTLYLVYPEPSTISTQEDSSCGAAPHAAEYSWSLVTRGHCKKGCTGPLLHPLRRFGALGCRFNGGCVGKADSSGSKQTKQSKYMYFAIDEAGTHVGSKTFRLIAAVHDETGTNLLSTACSQPIRVVANNDIPRGAAHISLVATISRGGWPDQQQDPSCRVPISNGAELWSEKRLQQTTFADNDQHRASVCYSAGLASAADDSRLPRAADVPLQSNICRKRARGATHQLRPITAVADSSTGVNLKDESVHCTGESSDTSRDSDADEPYPQQDDTLAPEDHSEGAHLHTAEQLSKHSTLNSDSCADHNMEHEHEARVDPAETLLWQLEGKPMSAGPFTPRSSQPSGTMRLTCHAINCNQSFLDEYSDLRDPGPGPATSWDAAWHAQAYFSGGNSPVVQSPAELPSSRSWPSQQCHGICPGNEESHPTHTTEEMDVTPRKRLHTMRQATDYSSTVRSYSSPTNSGQNQSSTPWRKALQRGFLFPTAPSCPKLVGRSPSDVYGPTETQASVRALQATCIAQLEEELERQSNQLRHQRAMTRVLQVQLGSNKQEIQWLRDRVCQLQHGQHIRHTIAARPATCRSQPEQPSTLFLPNP
ncbi:hypothetical protein ABBQ32_008669 [Trebouxia sp. C0010 RCD-2024]